jgi:sec-independent protein translocase protein TatC
MPVAPDERLSLYEHLDELRKRIFWSVIVLAVGVLVAAIFTDRLFDLLLYPLQQVPNLDPQAYKIATFSPTEPFMISLKVWVVAGILMASPFLIWQLWAYVGPAFTSNEKKYFYPIVFATSALFLGGVVFGYLVVLPRGLQFLLGFNAGSFNIQNRASDYFTFVALFILAFGAVFEMPVILVLLAKVGVIDDKFLRKHRRYAIIICAVVAAVITPSQDAFSMLAMFIPLLILYEVSIPLARMVQPKKEVRPHGEDAGIGPKGDDAGGDDLSRAPA